MDSIPRESVIEVAEKILQYYETLPVGTETYTFQAFSEVYGEESILDWNVVINGEQYDRFVLFSIDREIRDRAKKHGLILDSSMYDDMVTGLPYNIGYLIKKRSTSKKQ